MGAVKAVREMDRHTCWECGHRGADVYECHVHKLPWEIGNRVRLCGHCVLMMRDARLYVDMEDVEEF